MKHACQYYVFFTGPAPLAEICQFNIFAASHTTLVWLEKQHQIFVKHILFILEHILGYISKCEDPYFEQIVEVKYTKANKISKTFCEWAFWNESDKAGMYRRDGLSMDIPYKYFASGPPVDPRRQASTMGPPEARPLWANCCPPWLSSLPTAVGSLQAIHIPPTSGPQIGILPGS